MPLLSSFRLVVGRPSSSSFGTRTWWHVLCKPEATSTSLCWKDLDFLKQVILGALSAVNVRQCTTAVFWEDGFQCFHPKMKRNGNREWRGTDVLAVAAVSPCMSGSKRQATQLKSTSLICLMDFPKAGTQQIGYLLVYGNKLHRVNAECWHCKFGQHLLIACFFLDIQCCRSTFTNWNVELCGVSMTPCPVEPCCGPFRVNLRRSQQTPEGEM